MAIKIDVGKYQIQQLSPYQYTVGLRTTDKNGRDAISSPRYYQTMSATIQYLRQKLVLENEIHTVDELEKAEESAIDQIKVWIATTPLKGLEVPK